VLGGDYIGDDVHDERGIALIARQALDQLLDRSRFLLEAGTGDPALELLQIGRVVARFEEEGAKTHIKLLCVQILTIY
jgi:hypothetical protein